jgi:hypothetical protein
MSTDCLGNNLLGCREIAIGVRVVFEGTLHSLPGPLLAARHKARVPARREAAIMVAQVLGQGLDALPRVQQERTRKPVRSGVIAGPGVGDENGGHGKRGGRHAGQSPAPSWPGGISNSQPP